MDGADRRGDGSADKDDADRDGPVARGACGVHAIANQNTACDAAKHDDESDRPRRNIRRIRRCSSNTNPRQPNTGRHNMESPQ